MPHVIVHGIPPGIDPTALENLWNAIRTSVAAIGELAIEKDQVTVWFPPDLLITGLGEELLITVEGLHKKHPEEGKPGRTPAVQNMIANAILDSVQHTLLDHAHLPDCAKVEIYVKKFDTDKDGYASWQK